MRLEEHVSNLLQRRDHLLAVNARLAIPLTGPPATPQTNHPHTGILRVTRFFVYTVKMIFIYLFIFFEFLQ